MARTSPAMSDSVRKRLPHSVPTLSARALAYSILLDVEAKGSYASELLRSRLDADADAREAALATELVMGTLRWQRLLDFFIARYTRRRTGALDREVLVALRLGIYQLRHLTRIPARAAVNESVELVKRGQKKSAAALVNAALRRAASETERPAVEFVPTEMGVAEALAIRHSHPTWLVERWLRLFGEQKTIALLAANNKAHEHACAIYNPTRRAETIASLEKSGITFETGRLLRDAIVVRRGNVAGAEAFRKNWIAMQNEASQMIPMLLGVKAGESVLDICAAPGGKTLALANRAGEEGRVTACDLHEGRLRTMRERLEATETTNVSFVTLDGTRALPFANKFERILIDAPCSGTGTLSRNPEIRWRLKADDLQDLHRRQAALIQSALECLSSTGVLLYSTCSLEPEENEAVIRDVLAANLEFRCEPLKIPRDLLAPGVNAQGIIGEDGAFRTFPPTHHTDGFFAARIVHK